MEENSALGAALEGQGAAEATTVAYDGGSETTLIDIIAILWRRKWMIIGITAAVAVAAVAYSIISIVLPPEKSPLPNRYKPQAVMLIKESGTGKGGGLASALSSSGLAGIASLAGVNVSTTTTNSALAQYLATSNPLLDAVADEFGLIEKFEIEKSPRGASRRRLAGMLSADIDEKSGIFAVSFEDIDPVFAQSVVNFVVDWLDAKFAELGLDTNKIQKENLEKSIQATYNEILRLERELQDLGASVNFGGMATLLPSVSIEVSKIQLDLKAQQEVYTQLKTELELLKIQMQGEAPIFQILERPEVPDEKSGPSRGTLCIFATLVAGLLSVFLAFGLHAFYAVRNDPASWGKIAGTKEGKR